MKLLRVQVPDFRVLKNIDISFEKDFVPNIFPLGSQNGGGKSTLLQLIFVLLHCSGDSDKHEFIKNMLCGFEIDENSQKRVLAKFDIWDGEKIVNLEFVVYRDSYARELVDSYYHYEIYTPDALTFSTSTQLKNISEKIANENKKVEWLQKIINELYRIQTIKKQEERNFKFQNLINEVKLFEVANYTINKSGIVEEINIEQFQKEILEKLNISQLNLQEYNREYREAERNSQIVFDFLRFARIVYISNYSTHLDTKHDKVIVCHIDNIDISIADYFLKNISEQVFLTAPATQVFIFLAKNSRNLLFKQQKNTNGDNYYSQLNLSQSKLTRFFTYSFLAVDLLIEIFKLARDKDFKQAIETGEYGNNYQQLVNDLNQILLNKKININPDLSGFTFKLDSPGNDIELYPEDLSHGELKRLSIYAWIKYNIIENSIVLIDEIENGFHPDWQYQIIKDIAEWSPNNQYIIATHSYELCQAVTPAHVKELEPRLIKQDSES
ncbi:MAG: AAA family ATPase [Rivularia sp. ALOHA_DT_140]|nr:AAA family ATPase [Rivularia sp. ALOHA_DT_140]